MVVCLLFLVDAFHNYVVTIITTCHRCINKNASSMACNLPRSDDGVVCHQYLSLFQLGWSYFKSGGRNNGEMTYP